MQTESPATFSRRIPLIVAAAFFMENLDGSIVTTALPAIARNFDQPTLSLTLGISAYLVALAVFVPTAGWTSDRFGARNVFASAICVFTLASLLCGISQSPWSFILTRIVQGMSAALMSPVGRLVVLRETPKPFIIEAIGMITWPALIAPVVGPPLAGFLTTYLSWRWIFFINIPLGIVGAWLVIRMIPQHPVAGRTRFDGIGFVLTAGSLATLVQGLSVMSSGAARDTLGVVLIAIGALLAVVSIHHSRTTPNPLLDLRSVSVPTYAHAQVAGGLLARIAISSTPFLLPLMFQIGFGMQPFEAGLMLLVYMVGNLAMKSATTALLRRFGFYRVMAINGALSTAAIAACAMLTPGTARAVICVALVIAGMTRSMHFTSVNTLAFADIEPSHRAGASTLAAMTQQLASTLGVAFAAWALGASQRWRSAPMLSLADFRHALLASSLVMALGTLWALRLPRNAGAELARRG